MIHAAPHCRFARSKRRTGGRESRRGFPLEPIAAHDTAHDARQCPPAADRVITHHVHSGPLHDLPVGTAGK